MKITLLDGPFDGVTFEATGLIHSVEITTDNKRILYASEPGQTSPSLVGEWDWPPDLRGYEVERRDNLQRQIVGWLRYHGIDADGIDKSFTFHAEPFAHFALDLPSDRNVWHSDPDDEFGFIDQELQRLFDELVLWHGYAAEWLSWNYVELTPTREAVEESEQLEGALPF